MIPGVNPRQMRQAMKRMGIQQVDIDATEVIIKTPEKDIVITEPSVAKVNMMGQVTFQVMGTVSERTREATPTITEEDIQAVMEQARCSREKALEAIQEHQGDLAEAILSLQ